MILVLIGLAGGLGAVARYLLDALISARVGGRPGPAGSTGAFPLGIWVVNVTGSLLLGMVGGLVAGGLLPAGWLLPVGTGFLGGYTTFSTTAVDTVDLARERRWWAVLVNGPGQLAAAVAAAGLGLLLAAAVTRGA